MTPYISDILSKIDIVTPRYKPLVFRAVGATTLAGLALCSSWELIKITGLTVLTGTAYGIANDMIACRDCIEYFTVGNFYDGRSLKNRPIQSLNPNLNAIAWGTIATWYVCLIAGIALSIIARVPLPGITLKITAKQIAPYLAMAVALTLTTAHIESRKAQKIMQDAPYLKYRGVPLDFQAGWEACNVRNLTGYDALALNSIILSVGILAVRILKA
ncbi:hypothetical protein [Candidatus Rhabdochlamydia porcellionis]|jgi:hypothetical protein|uniref:Uncharacterized protein n=1 Tax=Candidatus Rhabdochlamydia porcellionis TaxID=225148 RepID=A0ABX8YZJ8_9BACT|nr:hypothetical protein [Candidatus Rhabdochlamydia porcellionis]QZA58415.1 hypothetical protein RHAB15C_0000288 [Candidatus Rhabdochlamydia porcellionis]